MIGPLPHSTRYPARMGYDEFYGYGRLNAYKAVVAADDGRIPPEAEITSPDWFTQVDPRQRSFAVGGYVNARAAYRCSVSVAPGRAAEQRRRLPRRRLELVRRQTVRTGPRSGVLGSVDVAALKSTFPPRDFLGNAGAQDSNGRPNTLPDAFTVRVLVTTVNGLPMSGEDRRQLFLHRDRDLLPRFPIQLHSDGDSSPLLVDLDGDNRNELVVATSDGLVHAFRSDGSELPGWPVHTASLPLHLGERAYGRGGVGSAHYAAVLGALAAGDLFGDGRLEVVADDNQGDVFAWDQHGRIVFHEQSNPHWSGAPLSRFMSCARACETALSAGSPARPSSLRLDGHGLDVIVAGEDRHVYAWHANGRPVAGFPVLVADPDKVASVDPVTQHIVFRNVAPNPGLSEDQGKIIDTPAVATHRRFQAPIDHRRQQRGVRGGDRR